MDVYFADRILAVTDPVNPTVVDDGAVVVDGALISWVGARSALTVDLDAAATVTELGPVTLMPGFFDCHVHLGFDGGSDPVARMKAESDAELLVLMLLNARRLLSVGVTTARELGARSFLDVVVRDAIASGMARGPRIVAAGRPLTVTGGHCWFMGAECDSVDDVRAMVRLHHKMGVDAIKVMSTGGFMTTGSAPWHAQFTLDELLAIVDEAHRLGKQVAAHAHGLEGIRRSVAAGVDTIEHCSFARAEGFLGPDAELVDAIAASRIAVCPTVNFRTLDLLEMRGPSFRHALPALVEAGVPIVAGTDAGINFIAHHGYVGALSSMAQLGMGLDDVLHAATGRAADVIGLGAVTGRLAPGLEADFVAAPGDPRTDLECLQHLTLVVSRGLPFVPDPLPSLELDAEAQALRRERLANALPGALAPGPEPACPDGTH